MDFDRGDAGEEIIAEPDDVVTPSSIFIALEFLQSNGWYILIVAVAIYYLWRTKISHFVEKWRKSREIENEISKLKKDPDIYKAREEARMAAMIKLQNKCNEQAARMKIIVEEKKKKKVEELISKNQHLFGGRRLDEENSSPMNGSRGANFPNAHGGFSSVSPAR